MHKDVFTEAKTDLGEALQEFVEYGGIAETEVDGKRCLVVYIDDNAPSTGITKRIPKKYKGLQIIQRHRLQTAFL